MRGTLTFIAMIIFLLVLCAPLPAEEDNGFITAEASAPTGLDPDEINPETGLPSWIPADQIPSGVLANEVLLPGRVNVTVMDEYGSPVTSIQRGNRISVFATFDPVGPPCRDYCILLLPANSSGYEEYIVFTRNYAGGGVTGVGFNFYIPPWVQIEGTARIVVFVEDAGVGTASFEVTP